MGFKRDVPSLRLTFQGDLQGLEIDVREVGANRYAEIQALAAKVADVVTEAGAIPQLEVMEALQELAKQLPDVVVGWNLEDDNGPIPCTAEALELQGMSFQLSVAMAWLAAMSTYADGVASTAVPADELNIPMVPTDS